MTAMAGLAATRALLEAALCEHRPLRLDYHGRRRIVSPHALGLKSHRLILLGYQAGTEARSPAGPIAPERGWRNLFVDEVEHLGFANPGTVWQSADNYNPIHPFNSIDHVIIAVPSVQRAPRHS
ncbi:MAG: hypothetical protein ACRDWN_06785 [Acidimicrobiales bacterium]